MFSVRINWNGTLGEQQDRSVYATRTYCVVNNKIAAGLTLHINDPETETGTREVALCYPAVAFVMNDAGVTVDTIRAVEPVHVRGSGEGQG